MSEALIQALVAGLKSNPNDQGLLWHLAKAYRDSGQLVDSITTLQTLIALNSSHAEAIDLLIELLADSEQSSLLPAYQALRDAMDSNQAPGLDTTQVSDRAQQTENNKRNDGAHETDANPVSTLDNKPMPNNVTAISSNQGGPDNGEKRVRGHKLALVTHNGLPTDKTDQSDLVEESHVYLSDVSGMEAVKRRLRLSFLAPLQNPELVKQYGKKVAGGLILYGPPGCGKTYIAKALAGELGAKFMAVTLSDVLDKYIGESEKQLAELFETARRNAPTVLFFDELDAIGQKRSNLKNSGMRTLVNQLLNELDSVHSDNAGVFMLAATNLPWDIDTALKRPGRFDRVVPVYPPDEAARRSLLSQQLANTPHEGVDIEQLVAQTHLFSGADLVHLCQSAIDVVFEHSLESGQVRPLTQADFATPLKEIKPSTRQWFVSARNYAMFANQGGVYDDLMEYINQNKL